MGGTREGASTRAAGGAARQIGAVEAAGRRQHGTGAGCCWAEAEALASFGVRHRPSGAAEERERSSARRIPPRCRPRRHTGPVRRHSTRLRNLPFCFFSNTQNFPFCYFFYTWPFGSL